MNANNLWAPWRISYIQGLTPAEKERRNEGCFLCDAAQAAPDPAQQADRLVLLCDQRGMLLLNRYPYTNGHLMAAPRQHVGDLSDLTTDQRQGLIELTELGNRLLRAALDPQGVNIGMNLGRCAGAGMPGHVHMHIVPRWAGDVNFMDVVGQVRVIPQALDKSYAALSEALAKITRDV